MGANAMDEVLKETGVSLIIGHFYCNDWRARWLYRVKKNKTTKSFSQPLKHYCKITRDFWVIGPIS